MNPLLQSILAVLAGLVFIFATHTGTDFILENIGVLPKGHLNVGTGLILLVIFYRTVFTIAGCYLTARLAPRKPLKHALVLGIIGFFLSAGGVAATADMNLAPSWYAWSLVVMALPAAWIGGKAYTITQG
jgi:hypothetical protein